MKDKKTPHDIIQEQFKEEDLAFSTECKFIGWLLINPELPQVRDLINKINPANLSVWGRMIHREMKQIIERYPDSVQYGRSQTVAFTFAVREMKIPYSYVLKCIDASDCWIPNGPNESEIKELTL